MLKALWISGLYYPKYASFNLLGYSMLILLEVYPIEKVQVKHVNFLIIFLYLGLVRNKIVLHFLQQRRSTLLLDYVVHKFCG